MKDSSNTTELVKNTYFVVSEFTSEHASVCSYIYLDFLLSVSQMLKVNDPNKDKGLDNGWMDR